MASLWIYRSQHVQPRDKECSPGKAATKRRGHHYSRQWASVRREGMAVGVYGSVAAVAFLCFLNSLTGDFVHDDIMAVKTNRDVMGHGCRLPDVFRNDFWGRPMADNTSHKSYRPLTILTFRLNYLLADLDPFGFHVVNVALHVIVSSLLTYSCIAILHWRPQMALYAGLLFASHPIHTEAVAGIVGRADILACLLFLLSFLSYISVDNLTGLLHSMLLPSFVGSFAVVFPSAKIRLIVDTETPVATAVSLSISIWSLSCLPKAIHPYDNFSIPPTRSWHWLTGSLLLALAAMLAKEQGITVLGVCVCYDWYCSQRGIIRFLNRRQLLSDCFPLLKRTFAVTIVMCLLVSFRMAMLNGSLPHFSEQDNPVSFSPHFFTRTLSYLYLLAFNSWLLLAPITLSYDWQMGSIPLVESVWDGRNLSTLLFLLLLAALIRCVFNAEKEGGGRTVVIALLFIIFPFLPATNLFFTVGFVVAERILYLPSLGFCLLVVHGSANLCRRDQKRKNFYLNLLTVLIILFAIKTVDRNKVWQSRQTLFRSGLDTLPQNAKMHYNFANLQKDIGNLKEAISHYKITLDLWPDHASAHNNLGTLLDDPIQAKFHFMEAIRINPLHPRAHFNIANLLSKEGYTPTAIRFMERAIQLDYTYTDAYTNLAAMYSEVGRHYDSEQLHQSLLLMEPDNPDVHNNYGAFLQKIGRTDEALYSYKQAISLQPNHTVALVNAAKLLRAMKKNSESEILYKRALAIEDDPKVRDHMGVLFLNTGRIQEAKTVYEQLLDKYPDDLDAKVHYAQVMLQERKLKDAEQTLLQVIHVNESHRDALRQLALLYSHMNKTTEALDFILRALKVCNNSDTSCAQLHAEHANILKDMDDMEKAAKSYKMAVQVNPRFTLAHLNLGVIYHIKRDFPEAWKHYRTALLLEPNNRILLENMEKLRRAELASVRIQSPKASSDSCR